MAFTSWMLGLAQASGAGGGSAVPGGGGGGLMSMMPILLMVVVFYFLLIRPQQKKAKEHRAMLSALKVGEEIVTSGGLLGRITGLSDRIITIEVAEKIRLRVLRSHILGRKDEIKEGEVERPSTAPASS